MLVTACFMENVFSSTRNYYTDFSVFIEMLTRRHIFAVRLFLLGQLFSMISEEIAAFVTAHIVCTV